MEDYFCQVRRKVIKVACLRGRFADAQTDAYVIGDLVVDVLREVVHAELDTAELCQELDFLGCFCFATETEQYDEENLFDVLLGRVLGERGERFLDHREENRVGHHEALLQEVRDHPQKVSADFCVGRETSEFGDDDFVEHSVFDQF